jgi:hypothetical protein
MREFKAELLIIGVNPFVFVPEPLLFELFKLAGKERGHIPVHGTVNGKKYRQTLLRYRGEWRLYINTAMLKNSPKRIGETLNIEIGFDPAERSIKAHPLFEKALDADKAAKKAFEGLAPSRKKEIIRYISSLKQEDSIEKNIKRAIGFLTGKNGFVGRKNP